MSDMYRPTVDKDLIKAVATLVAHEVIDQKDAEIILDDDIGLMRRRQEWLEKHTVPAINPS